MIGIGFFYGWRCQYGSLVLLTICFNRWIKTSDLLFSNEIMFYRISWDPKYHLLNRNERLGIPKHSPEDPETLWLILIQPLISEVRCL